LEPLKDLDTLDLRFLFPLCIKSPFPVRNGTCTSSLVEWNPKLSCITSRDKGRVSYTTLIIHSANSHEEFGDYQWLIQHCPQPELWCVPGALPARGSSLRVRREEREIHFSIKEERELCKYHVAVGERCMCVCVLCTVRIC